MIINCTNNGNEPFCIDKVNCIVLVHSLENIKMQPLTLFYDQQHCFNVVPFCCVIKMSLIKSFINDGVNHMYSVPTW